MENDHQVIESGLQQFVQVGGVSEFLAITEQASYLSQSFSVGDQLREVIPQSGIKS